MAASRTTRLIIRNDVYVPSNADIKRGTPDINGVLRFICVDRGLLRFCLNRSETDLRDFSFEMYREWAALMEVAPVSDEQDFHRLCKPYFNYEVITLPHQPCSGGSVLATSNYPLTHLPIGTSERAGQEDIRDTSSSRQLVAPISRFPQTHRGYSS